MSKFIDLRKDFDPIEDTLEIHRTVLYESGEVITIGRVSVATGCDVEGDLAVGEDILFAFQNPASETSEIFLYGKLTRMEDERDSLQQRTNRLLMEMDLLLYKVKNIVAYTEEYALDDQEPLRG